MGYAFISADYRLLIPNTGKEIIEDIQDAFKFVSQNTLPGRNYTFKLDGDRIAASGNGAGGLCARLAAIHATPRPKVLVDIYGIGVKSNVSCRPFHTKCEVYSQCTSPDQCSIQL